MKKKRIETKSFIGVFILIIILLVLLLTINIIGLSKNKEKKPITTKEYTTIKRTTTSEVDDYSEDKKSVELTFGSEKEKINIKTYVSYLGFQIDYMNDYFTPTTVSNKVVMITSNNDSETYLKIEPLDEKTYYNEYEKNEEETKENYTFNYEYLRGNNTFVKITLCYRTNNTISMAERMNYMLNTFYFK